MGVNSSRLSCSRRITDQARKLGTLVSYFESIAEGYCVAENFDRATALAVELHLDPAELFTKEFKKDIFAGKYDK